MSLIRQYNRPIALTSSTLSNLFITSANLGINNTNPNNNLDITGSLRITSGNLLATFNSNTLGPLITTGGNVGVNTSSPAYRLDLGGTLRINHPAPNGLYIGGSVDPSLYVRSSHGNLDLGVASIGGSYSTSAAIGDSVIRSASNRKLILQTGAGAAAICLTTNGNIAIGSTSQNTRLSITPASVEPKITLWDGAGTTNHYGFGVSNGQLNYHVDITASDHVFWAGGKNGSNGSNTELLRVKGNGLIQSTNFRTIQVYANNNVDWTNVNSGNFTVGSGSKFLIINFSWWRGGSVGNGLASFDIYTSTNTLITTYTHNFYFNQFNTHVPGTFLYVIPNSTMGAGTFYIKFRHNVLSDGNDYLYATIINFPFN